MVAKEGKTLEDVLKKLKAKRIKAESGSDSAARGIIGMPGQDFIIPVPLGITVYNQNGVLLGRYNIGNVILHVSFMFYIYLFVCLSDFLMTKF